MKKTIISLLLAVCLIHSSFVFAGKLKGKVQQTGDHGMISFSLNGNGGTAMSSGISKAFSFNPNVGIEVGWGNFGIGIDASTFSTQPSFDFNAYTSALNTLDFLSIKGANSNWRSTSITFGPSYTIPFRTRIPSIGIVVKRNYPIATLTLSLKGGVTINQAPDFSVTNISNQKQIASYTAPSDFKNNAFTLKPSVAFSYWFTKHMALNANVQYAAQLGQTAFKTGYKDLTNVSISTPISPDQFTKNISTAPTITSSTVGPDKFISFGLGLTYRFGGNGDGSVKGVSEQRKGWDGSVKGKNIAEKGIQENGLKKNEAEYVLADAEVKAIAETLVNMRKGWDGSIKGGNITEEKGINENGLKKNEAKSENTNLITSTAQTLVNLARKGWDGSIKGNKVAYEPNQADLELVTETLESIRKGWDGSIKGNKTEYVANEADVKAISETMVNLRKGWDGSVKGNKKGINEKGLKKNEFVRKGWDGSIKGSNVSIPINGEVIHVQTTPEGCIVLFSDNGFAVNSKTKTMTVLSKTDHTNFAEKVNAGLHAAGGALAQGASLLGGALPGGAVISAAISSVSTTKAGASGGAASASYARTADKKKKIWDSRKDDNCDGLMNIPDGDYELEVVYMEKAADASAAPTTTQVTISFSSISNVLKTKHDTAKNSVGNIR